MEAQNTSAGEFKLGIKDEVLTMSYVNRRYSLRTTIPMNGRRNAFKDLAHLLYYSGLGELATRVPALPGPDYNRLPISAEAYISSILANLERR